MFVFLPGLAWIGLPVELSFHKEIVEHENIEELMSQLTNVVEGNYYKAFLLISYWFITLQFIYNHACKKVLLKTW